MQCPVLVWLQRFLRVSGGKRPDHPDNTQQAATLPSPRQYCGNDNSMYVVVLAAQLLGIAKQLTIVVVFVWSAARPLEDLEKGVGQHFIKATRYNYSLWQYLVLTLELTLPSPPSHSSPRHRTSRPTSC